MDIIIKGAAQNSLKHIDCRLPGGAILALLGPSGSGKSSLAYDVLFAESRRRFLDCLSPGARRLLARPEKAQIDSIEGLPPALCLEQSVPHGQSRNLLGNITELLDYLRILYAAIGIPYDPETGQSLERMSAGEIVNAILELPHGARLTLLAPLRSDFGQGEQLHSDLMELEKLGYLRIRLRGELHELQSLLPQDGKAAKVAPPKDGEHCELVIDRLQIKAGSSSRIADSVAAGLRVSPDEIRVLWQNGREGEEQGPQSYFTRFCNPETGFTLPDLSPNFFSHYSSLGACPRCHGRGVVEAEPKEGKERPRQKTAARSKICPDCHGMRLNPTALAIRLNWGGDDLNLAQLATRSIDQLHELLPQLHIPDTFTEALQPSLDALKIRLQCLKQLGLGYLSLDRASNSLSGGELQRARLAGQIGGGLSGVLYILDEPSIGLHPKETEMLINALKQLQARGNTILIVEHDPQLLAAADYLVEMGPGSGPKGGEILAQGSYEELLKNLQSPSGAWLAGRRHYSKAQDIDLAQCSWAQLEHASARNLKDITFRFPLGALTCLSGPSGSGKSSLIHEELLPAIKERRLMGGDAIDRVLLIDQSPLGQSARSTPATASGLLDILRPLFAALPLSRQRGYTASRFSLNVRGGRCDRCMGTGQLQLDMNFLADMYSPCDVCGGARYNRETLEVTWRGKSIAQILAMSVDEALEEEFLVNTPGAANILRAMQELGLGYLQLDRASNSLSGGEAQRIKLAAQLADVAPKRGRRIGQKARHLLILDEPSTGLHFNEVDLLLQAIYRLRDAGHSILCIEHHQGILSRADYLIEMGPGSGGKGGEIVYEGKVKTDTQPTAAR